MYVDENVLKLSTMKEGILEWLICSLYLGGG